MWLVQTGSIWQVSCHSHSTSNSLSNRSNDQSACRTSPSSIQTNPTDRDNTNHMCIVKRNFRSHTHARLSCSRCMAPGVEEISHSPFHTYEHVQSSFYACVMRLAWLCFDATSTERFLLQKVALWFHLQRIALWFILNRKLHCDSFAMHSCVEGIAMQSSVGRITM